MALASTIAQELKSPYTAEIATKLNLAWSFVSQFQSMMEGRGPLVNMCDLDSIGASYNAQICVYEDSLSLP